MGKETGLAMHNQGWRLDRANFSLPEVYRSMSIPKTGSSFRKFLAFAGPGYLVAVGYMDPVNWATDIAGGSMFGYSLLFVILLSKRSSARSRTLARRGRQRTALYYYGEMSTVTCIPNQQDRRE
jgi:manganese transport protein